MRKSNGREWDNLALLLVITWLFLMGFKENKPNNIADNSKTQNPSIESLEEEVSPISESIENNMDSSVDNIELKTTLIDLPLVENKSNMFEKNIPIDNIFVFDTNIGNIILTKDDDKVVNRVIYEIDCQSGDEIMPFNIFFYDAFYEDFMHDAYALPLKDDAGIVYQTNDYQTVYKFKGLYMVPLNDFLKYNGFENEIQDTYTYDEVLKLYYNFNKVVEQKTLNLKQ